MKIKKYCRLPLVLTVALGNAMAFPAKSQEPNYNTPHALTLEAAVQRALTNNPEIRVLQADIASARGAVNAAKTWENPQLSIAPGYKAVREADTQFHGDFGLDQKFEWPGKRALRRALAQKDVELRRLALDGFRSQLAIQVRRAYDALQTAHQVVALREQQLAMAKAFADAARKKVDAGFAPDFEATKAEVEIVTSQKSLRDSRAQYDAVRVQLNTLMGASPNQSLRLASQSLENPKFPGRTSMLELALAKNTAIQVQEAEAERAGLNVDSVRKSRWPDITAGPSLEYTRDEQIVGLGVSLPLPLWNRKQGEIATANAELEKMRARLEQLQRDIVSQVTTAAQNFAAAQDSLAYYTPQLREKLKIALDTAEQSYSEGRTSLLLYLEAQRTYFDTQADYYSTQQQLHAAEAELASAIGLPIDQIPQP
mgnify:CR=1 FL=1